MGQTSLVKNILYRGALSFFNLVIPLLVVPYVYRAFNPETIGEVEYATTIFNYFNLFGVLGIYAYGLREVSRIRNDKSLVNEVYTDLFVIGCGSNILVLCAYLCFAFSADYSLNVILIILGFNFLANIFYTEWINEAFEDFRFIAIKTIILRTLYVIAIISFVKNVDDVYIYVGIIVIGNFLNYFISFLYSLRYTSFSICKLTFSVKKLKKYLSPLFLILILNNSSILYTNLDRIMLGYYSGNEPVAFYSVGQKIMEMTRALLMTLIFVSMPRLSFYLKNDYNSYLSGLKRISRLILLLVIPVAIGLVLLGKPIVCIFAGEQYEAAVIPLYVFAFRFITLMIECITAQQVLFLHGRERVLAKFGLFYGVINLSLNYILILCNIFTPTTAIVSTAVSEFFLIITELCYIKRCLNIEINIINQNTLRYFVYSLFFIPFVCLIRFIFSNEIIILLLSVCLCALFYGLVLYKIKDEPMMELISKITSNKRIGQGD